MLHLPLPLIFTRVRNRWRHWFFFSPPPRRASWWTVRVVSSFALAASHRDGRYCKRILGEGEQSWSTYQVGFLLSSPLLFPSLTGGTSALDYRFSAHHQLLTEVKQRRFFFFLSPPISTLSSYCADGTIKWVDSLLKKKMNTVNAVSNKSNFQSHHPSCILFFYSFLISGFLRVDDFGLVSLSNGRRVVPRCRESTCGHQKRPAGTKRLCLPPSQLLAHVYRMSTVR